MPTVTLSLTTAAMAKLQEAVDAYNQNSDTTLTAKQWAIRTLKENAVGILMGEYMGPASTAAESHQAQLEGEVEIT